MEYQPPKVYFPGIQFNEAFYKSDEYVTNSEIANKYLLRIGVAISSASSTLFQGAVTVVGDFTAALASITDLVVSNSILTKDLTVSNTTSLYNLVVTNTSVLNDLVILGEMSVFDMIVNNVLNTNELIVNNLSTLKDLVVTGMTNLQNLTVSGATNLQSLTVSGLSTFQNIIINGTLTLGSVNVIEIIFNTFINIKVSASNLVFTNNNTGVARFDFGFLNKAAAVQILTIANVTGIMANYHWFENSYSTYLNYDGSIFNFITQTNKSFRFIAGSTILQFSNTLMSYAATIVCNKLSTNPTQEQYIQTLVDVLEFRNNHDQLRQFSFVGYGSNNKIADFNINSISLLKDTSSPSINSILASHTNIAGDNLTTNSITSTNINIANLNILNSLSVNNNLLVPSIISTTPAYYLTIKNGNRNGYIPVYE